MISHPLNFGKASTVWDWAELQNSQDIQKLIQSFKKSHPLELPSFINLQGFTVPLEACQAFDYLKIAFFSAPVLAHPDPNQPFILEVNASDVAIGVLLSQKMESQKEMHLCAFFP